MMTSGLWSGIATAILFVSFIALCVWAFSPSQKRRWKESAELPFLGDDDARPSAPPPTGGSRHE
jgi:cytochrome c oxidase cbb3-type subunit IV